MTRINQTHDRTRRSWIESANDIEADFPIQNLPFGCFQRPGGSPRGGVAIGDLIVDLRELIQADVLRGDSLAAAQAASGPDLLPLVQLGCGPASALRAALFELLMAGGTGEDHIKQHAEKILVAQASAKLLLPLRPHQFTDMCASTFHIGRRSGNDDRGEPICPPVFRRLPVGYDGRASSIVVSGTPVRRPNGSWLQSPGDIEPKFGPEPRQDYELEVAIWLGGSGNPLGEPMSIPQASESIFGFGLLNDWSSRGIQIWEAMLGPFLGKSMATSVSPWIVTAEALAPFRISAFTRPAGDPAVPAYLFDTEDQAHGGLDLSLEAALVTSRMSSGGEQPFRICQTNFRHMYWTPAQMVAHHASNGCSLSAGDLIGSGTCSGPPINAAACFLERSLEDPVELANQERRKWLLDGDTVIMRARASRDGFVSIGFGELRGQLLEAAAYPMAQGQRQPACGGADFAETQPTFRQ